MECAWPRSLSSSASGLGDVQGDLLQEVPVIRKHIFDLGVLYRGMSVDCVPVAGIVSHLHRHSDKLPTTVRV